MSSSAKPPLHDQIREMQRKNQLLEGDKTAYYESSQSTMKKNREYILQLRQENKRLHRKLAENLAGKHVIKEAFHNRGSQKDAYVSAKAAITDLDQKVLIKVKRLNAMRHSTQTSRQHLEELQMQYQRMKPEGITAKSADAHTPKTEEDLRRLRVLENSLEKTQLKCQEAERIMKGYLEIKNHLQVSPTCTFGF